MKPITISTGRLPAPSSLPAPLAVTPHVAATMLGISERTLWDLRQAGEIPHFKIGKLWRIAVEDLNRFIDRQREAFAAASDEHDDEIDTEPIDAGA